MVVKRSVEVESRRESEVKFRGAMIKWSSVGLFIKCYPNFFPECVKT